MNNTYLYEGGFLSFLSLIVELMKKRIIPDDMKEVNEFEKTLLNQEIWLTIKDERKNIEQIRKVLSKEVSYIIYNVFLSNHKKKEMIIYNFLRIYFKEGNKVLFMRRIDIVNEALSLSRKVRREAHLLKGFLRFQEMKNQIYYAEITPDNNIIGILSNHFRKRLQEEYWIIKDKNRKIYAIYDKKNINYVTEEEIISLNLEKTNQEDFIEDLWKTFHKTVAIKERENRRCQQNFMPKKYWKNMLEMENEI